MPHKSNLHTFHPPGALSTHNRYSCLACLAFTCASCLPKLSSTHRAYVKVVFGFSYFKNFQADSKIDNNKMKMLRCVVCARRIVIYCVLFQMLDDLELTHAYTHQYIDIHIYIFVYRNSYIPSLWLPCGHAHLG